MPRAHTRSRRWSSAALLLFQAITFTTWQALEAWQVDFTPDSHVEQAGTTGCPAPHDEALCRVCQVSTRGLAAPVVRLPVVEPDTPSAAPRLVIIVSTPAVLQVGSPRAPPSLVDRNHRPA